MTIQKQFRFYWAWEDEKEEAWLRAQSQAGRRLVKVTFPGIYAFELGEPRDMVYRLDFFAGKDQQAYRQIFEDAGWEHAGSYGSWQYFRKAAAAGEDLQIFTDRASKAEKYRRVLLTLVLVAVLLFPNFINILIRQPGDIFQVLTFILFLFEMLMVYAIVMLLRRIRQLKNR